MKEDNGKITANTAFDRYADMVYRLAVSHMKSIVDAEDVFQEVFVRLVRNIHKLESWEHVKAWLIKVTINCVRKYYEQYWNRNVFLIGEWGNCADNEWKYMMDEEHPVKAAVSRLPFKYRQAVVLFYYEQFTVAEISEMTRQKETTVKSQLFRARQLLRKELM